MNSSRRGINILCDIPDMLYPCILTRIYNDLEFYIPDPALVQPTYEKLLSVDSNTPFPFWAKTWPSAYELAAFLRGHPEWIAGKKVLELGAGTGLPSFAIAHLASALIISDHAPEAVSLAEKNIGLLGLQTTTARLLDWNRFPEDCKADILLLSDINYDSNQFSNLLSLILRFLDQGGTVILSTPQRINITPFAEALQPFIKESLLRVHKGNDADIDIRILVLSIADLRPV